MPGNFNIDSATFAAEFARFVTFLGTDELQSSLTKVDQKLRQLPGAVKMFYGDRYFFHEQCVKISEGDNPFQLDVTNFAAVRAANLIAGINRAKSLLSAPARGRLRAMCLDNLKPNRDVRQLEHEIRCLAYFGLKGFEVSFADLENEGRFDFICRPDTQSSFEVECKTVSEDTGSQIKIDMVAQLASVFQKSMLRKAATQEAGIFVIELRRPADQCKNLLSKTRDTLDGVSPSCEGVDFSFSFLPRPLWGDCISNGAWASFKQATLNAPEFKNCAHFVTKIGNRVFALAIRPHKESTLAERAVEVLKDAADQCSKSRASMLWLHFVGLAEDHFLDIAQFSIDSRGGGLNALVANALHPKASSTDRSHVNLVRFSGDAAYVETKTVLDSNLLLAKAKSIGGACYDVPNPNCKFPLGADF